MASSQAAAHRVALQGAEALAEAVAVAVVARVVPPLRFQTAPRSNPGRSLSLAAALRGIGQTLQGSFSAVSKPNFASKYAFESSRRDLHNALLCTAL